MNKLLTGFILLILGVATGFLANRHISDIIESTGLFEISADDSAMSAGEKEVLYWVAPMDANYRRDEPGQSPMGMDLVPVYAGDGNTEDGVVKISPTVENNLGVRVSQVKSGTLNRTINTVGYVSFDEEKIFHVHSRVEGWVERLHVKSVGQTVQKGKKLFELYSPDLVNSQEEYLTALKSKNKILINASKSRLRFLGIGNAQIKRLEKTRKVRQRIDIYSEHNGFINELNIREGMFIKPATDVLSIGQIDTVWVIAEVFEQQSSWIKTGQKVEMNVGALPGIPWLGTVDYIYPVLDAKTRTLRVRVRFDNPKEQLKPNMYARLNIQAQTEQETSFIPREALIRSGRMDRVVKSLGEGKYLSVAVKTGIESDDVIEILKGLSDGESIVTSAQFLIDSESSLTASFERMEDPMNGREMGSSENPNQAWIEGEVKNVMPGHNMLTIQHDPVDAWGWPTMIMDFTAIDGIKIDGLKENDSIRFLVEKLDSGSIQIIEIDGIAPTQVWIDGEIKSVMPGHSMLTIQHQPVDAWGWPSMIMDFTVQKEITIDHLKADSNIRVLVKKLDTGGILIVDIEGQQSTKDSMDDSQAWIKGSINSIDRTQAKLNLNHEPVKVWGWPSMMMDFPVSKSLDISQLKKGQSLEFLVKKKDSGAIEIVDLKQGQ